MLEKIDKLTSEDNRNFYINNDSLKEIKTELDDFLKDEKEMQTISFSKRVMHSQEIKTNNNIEGYIDDVSSIEKIIKESRTISDANRKNRILNMYKGYQYILKKKEIDKTNLKHLYKLLSNELLSTEDIQKMGKYYRNDEVFIFFSEDVAISPDKGIDYTLLEDKMDLLLSYLNNNEDIDTMTDYYIKSQIAHFYFVYLHPYFDINGRSARTTSMWYLINNEAYPYTIFNRAIHNTKTAYYREIKRVKETHNVTTFVNYLMNGTALELEKEYVLNRIRENNSNKISSMESVALLFILSMKGLKTLKDLTYAFNLNNDKKRVGEVYDEMVRPLLDKNIINKVRDTDSMYNGNNKNFVFELNTDKLELNPNKIRRLQL